MHWWKFNALFDSLNENTELKKRIAYRMMDISKIKNKEEKRRIRRIQKQIAIPVVNVMSDEDIANAF
ncbi:bacteriophage Gp15 family protein [Allocoprobacillus halotolerans]|uniref:Bacteriophage Gp15 family protein n=1 Tax=Allocoprobacillus halotolerans TaxID=2944914 RepID=A0ABY5I3M1_9FIRM|nr:Gp15 family bacteriophage protein [Allocoprobacillus halotolerans]UTY39382.1 bacteriophage Gp15 family protein [Allocoprobacillus halotolerans]